MAERTQIQIYESATDHFDILIKDIRHARTQILIETYIFENDTVGKQIAQALSDASARGVEVLLLIDGFGSMALDSNVVESLKAHKVDVRIYHPMPWQIYKWRYSPTLNSGKWFHHFIHINRRNHRNVSTVIVLARPLQLSLAAPASCLRLIVLYAIRRYLLTGIKLILIIARISILLP